MFELLNVPPTVWSGYGPIIGAILGAMIGGFLSATLVAYANYKANCKIKRKEQTACVRRALDEYYKAGSLFCCVSPDIGGTRFEHGVGGWDGFCNILNRVRSEIDLLNLWGDSSCGEKIFKLCESHYHELFEASVERDFRGLHENHALKIGQIRTEWQKLLAKS